MKIMQRIILCLVVLLVATPALAQHYVKLNTLYAIGGVVNPQVEFTLSKHSTFQAELVYSPWQSIKGHPMHFGIFLNEYRYFIKEHNSGFYIGGNAGLTTFKLSKPMIRDWRLQLANTYGKGYGFMFGLAVGYEHRFAKRWLVDLFVGYSFVSSFYNGYSLDHKINMEPPRPDWKQPPSPDPFNGSSEWLPNKIGVSIGFLISKEK